MKPETTIPQYVIVGHEKVHRARLERMLNDLVRVYSEKHPSSLDWRELEAIKLCITGKAIFHAEE